MGRPRRERPTRELDAVAAARAELDRRTAELHEAIRAAAAAGSPLRPIAEAAGLSVESARTIIGKGT